MIIRGVIFGFHVVNVAFSYFVPKFLMVLYFGGVFFLDVKIDELLNGLFEDGVGELV